MPKPVADMIAAGNDFHLVGGRHFFQVVGQVAGHGFVPEGLYPLETCQHGRAHDVIFERRLDHGALIGIVEIHLRQFLANRFGEIFKRAVTHQFLDVLLGI